MIVSETHGIVREGVVSDEEATRSFCRLLQHLQDYLSDGSSWVALGNMWCFLGMALTTFFCWFLPLLNRRKLYAVGGLAIFLVLLLAQETAVSSV